MLADLLRVGRVAAKASARRLLHTYGSSPVHSAKGGSVRLCAADFFAALAGAARSQRRRTDTCAKNPATRAQVRITRRHPVRRKFRTDANRVAYSSRVPQRVTAGTPERHGLTRAGPVCGAWQPNRPSVDTPRPSDMVESRKTCGISIGSASSTPPVAPAAANVRQLASMASDDDHKAGRGVRRWVPK